MSPLFARPLDCEIVRRSLDAYLDGALSEKEEKKLRMHLEHCADCRKALAECEKWKRAIIIDPVIPPASLHDRVMTRIHHEKRKPSPICSRKWRFLGSLCVFFLIVGVLLLPLFRFDGNKTEDAEAMPQRPSHMDTSDTAYGSQSTADNQNDKTESLQPDGVTGNTPDENSLTLHIPATGQTVCLIGENEVSLANIDGKKQTGTYKWLDKDTLEISIGDQTAVFLCTDTELLWEGGDLLD